MTRIKDGTLIKVIASKPSKGQTDINHLIGKTFKGLDYDEEYGEIGILEEGQTQQTLLNKEEYVVIE